jgi:hypothetical protein
VSTTVEASRPTVLDVYADYAGWPRLFPTIGGVRLLARQGPKLVLEVDHVEGKVRNELVVRPPSAIDLWEEKRHYDARFSNRFETAAGGTPFTVRGDIRLKGWARLLQPFLGATCAVRSSGCSCSRSRPRRRHAPGRPPKRPCATEGDLAGAE